MSEPTSASSGSPPAFRALQERLPALWRSIQSDDAEPHCSVIVPSLSMEPSELAKIQGVVFYEERLLFILMRLADPRARVIYLTSEPIPEEILDYYLQLLPGVPGWHARRRLKLLCTYDGSARPLTEKLLERPRLIRRIRDWVGDRRRAFLTVFNTSPLERELALALDIPLNGVNPELLHLGTKSGSRKVFRHAGVAMPTGFEDVSAHDVVDHLLALDRAKPSIKKAVVKLNTSFAGEGNATFVYPPPGERDAATLRTALGELRFNSRSEEVGSFLAKLTRLGGIVEEQIEADEVRSPSVQLRITPTREVRLVSTHEQVLGGGTGQAYEGCRFPAEDDYREVLQQEALKVGEVLRDQGVISRFGVDFLVWREAGGPWQTAAIEVNLRMGATTFPFLALEFLTRGSLRTEDGLFLSRRNTPKFYVATDVLQSPRYRGLLPEDLIDLAIEHDLLFDPGPEKGVLFHMIGALSQFGKLGLISIGDSRVEAQELFDAVVRVLDAEGGGTTVASPLPGSA